ncbi:MULTISPECIES: DUF4865 family protein [unclassified Pseudomonas]|uniref:DUF4865 family protein n=1 Tax=unclassified Pseudomonas TaxID=196821 RepID=UPI0025E24742|nr:MULTISPECIES: DUF4865 family protein [unclassified Pseudomonas]
MFAMQYFHRLPSDYDMQVIRDRARQRASIWDVAEGLVFKAFVSQQRGQNGALGNLYASVYLWLNPTAAASFLTSDKFVGVIDSFGRPAIETWLPLDARRGPAITAAWLYREEMLLSAGADVTALGIQESAHNRHHTAQPETVAAWSVLDPKEWRLVRFRLSAGPVKTSSDATVYQVLHLAAPGLEHLS